MTLLKTIEFSESGPYSVFSADSDLSEFSMFEPIKALWDRRRNTKTLPAWRDFDIRDFEGWYGWLAVADIVSRTPYDAVYRLWGTQWTDVCHKDFTGSLYTEQFGALGHSTDSAGILEEHLRFWEEMSNTTNIAMAHGVMSWLDRSHFLFNKDFSDISLPLADDGDVPDKYLTVLWVSKG